MKNLLILIDADFVGGAETNYKYILPILEEKGWKLIFVTHGHKNLEAYFDKQNIRIQMVSNFEPYYSLSEKGRFSFRNFMKNLISIQRNRVILKKIISEYKPVAIISNSMISHWLLSLVSSNHGFRKVMHLHDIVNRERVWGLYGIGLDQITKRMDRIIVVSDAVRQKLHPKSKTKITKLFNPVEVNLTERESKNAIKSEFIQLGMFARYTPWKGHREFLKIANELQDPVYKFICYGNPDGNEDYFKELVNTADSLQNRERIHLNNFSYDVAADMGKCGLILHLSVLPEPLSRILIEANALGIPVYAYDGGGTRELFETLKLAGVLVKTGDYRQMIEEIKQFPSKTFKFPSLKEITPEMYASKFEAVLQN